MMYNRGYFMVLLYETKILLDAGLNSEEIAAVLFMSSYLDSDNYLTSGEEVRESDRLTKLDVFYLLGLTKYKFKNYWDLITRSQIFTEDHNTGWIRFNRNILQGKLSVDYMWSLDTEMSCVKAIRNLYLKATKLERKTLMYIYQALPYVGVRLNRLCRNPDEEEVEKLHELSVADYCECVGYDPMHKRKFQNFLLKKVTVCGNHVFAILEGDVDEILINPKVYCRGDYDQVMLQSIFLRGGSDN